MTGAEAESTCLQQAADGPFNVRSHGGNPGYESARRVTLSTGSAHQKFARSQPVIAHPYLLSFSGAARVAMRVKECHSNPQAATEGFYGVDAENAAHSD